MANFSPSANIKQASTNDVIACGPLFGGNPSKYSSPLPVCSGDRMTKMTRMKVGHGFGQMRVDDYMMTAKRTMYQEKDPGPRISDLRPPPGKSIDKKEGMNHQR